MAVADPEKQQIESSIARARDGVGDRIDELDRRLRKDLDFKTFVAEHAPQLMAGGAVIGFLAGFGFPKPLKRLLIFGAPAVFIAYKVKQARDGREE